MRYASIILLIIAAALTMMIGCERKVVNEIVQETEPPPRSRASFNGVPPTAATASP